MPASGLGSGFGVLADHVKTCFVCRWDVFRKNLEDMRRHSDFKGLQPRKALPVKKSAFYTVPPKASLYTFPAPECMCAEPGNAGKTETLLS
jgi:hypothetical protein